MEQKEFNADETPFVVGRQGDDLDEAPLNFSSLTENNVNNNDQSVQKINYNGVQENHLT